MAAILPLFLFVFLFCAITWYGYVKYVRPTRMLDRLARAHEEDVAGFGEGRSATASSFGSALASLGKLIPLSPAANWLREDSAPTTPRLCSREPGSLQRRFCLP